MFIENIFSVSNRLILSKVNVQHCEWMILGCEKISYHKNPAAARKTSWQITSYPVG